LIQPALNVSGGVLTLRPVTKPGGAAVTPADLEADRVFWRYWGSKLFNAMLNAEMREGTAAMTPHDGYACRHFKESVVHLYRECPEGSGIGIAKRNVVAVDDPAAMEGLELCEWCQAKKSRG
jgi:hypothetical protein